MWDYGAFPAWVSEEQPGAIDPALQDLLQAWSDRVTNAMWGPNGPDAPAWDGPGDDVITALDAEGRSLAHRLAESVGWDIDYVPLP